MTHDRDPARDEWLRRLIVGQEEERRRVARELHDHFGQHLAALLLGINEVRSDDPGTRVVLDRLRAIVQTMAADVHRLARDLRPAALDDLGLILALRTLVEGLAIASAIPCDFSVVADPGPMPSHVEITVYRIVQEALTNVARHSHATHASVVLERRPEHVRVVIDDDGCGFDVADERRSPDHLGILGMTERAALVGGTIHIESTPGGGTSVFVTLPTSPTDAAVDR